MAVNAENLKSIVEQGHKLARAGHFDSAGILKAVQDFDKRLVYLALMLCSYDVALCGLCLRLIKMKLHYKKSFSLFSDVFCNNCLICNCAMDKDSSV